MNRNPLILMVRPAGFEPAAYGFEDQKSTLKESQCFQLLSCFHWLSCVLI